MRWPHFRRARRFGRTRANRVSLQVLAVCAALLLPLLIWDLGLIVQLILGGDAARVPQDWILGPWIASRIVPWPFLGDEQISLLVLLGFGIAVGILEVTALWLLNRAVQRAAMDVAVRLKAEIHRQAYRLGASDPLGGRRSQPEQLLAEQVERLRRGLVQWWNAVPYAIVALAALVFMALAVNLWLGLVVILAVILVRQIYRGFRARAEARAREYHAAATAAHDRLLENLRLTPLATGYCLPDAPGRPFAESLDQYRRAMLRARNSRMGLAPVLLLLIMFAVAYVVLVVGLSRYATIAGTVVLTLAVSGAYFPAARLYRLRGSLVDAEAAAADLFAYLQREPSVQEVDGARPIDRVGQAIQFEQVTLADSEGARLLDHLDLTIEAGKRVAILASNPRASMALAGLLVRLYDPAAGRVLFDGLDIAAATLDTVRGQSLLVPAAGMLFEGSVNENITCGDAGFTTLQITDAAKRARAHDFVMALPKGFATQIGNHGVQLSQCDAFRIGLARALLREPSVLILVEPDCQLDEDAAIHLDEALRLAAADRSLIVLPSRLDTLRSMDKVLLLHEGKLHVEGPHAELLRSDELYRHLNYVRFHAFRNIR